MSLVGEEKDMPYVAVGRENWQEQRSDWRRRPKGFLPARTNARDYAYDIETIQYQLVSGRRSMRIPLRMLIESLVDLWQDEEY
jgi:hypothetical protein